MTERLTADAFFDGLIFALAARGVRTISIRDTRFDQAVEGVFEFLRKSRPDVDARFRIRTHPVHGDSHTLRDCLAHAAQRDIVSLDNPEFLDVRIKLSPEQAKEQLATLPLGAALYSTLAGQFLQKYELVS